MSYKRKRTKKVYFKLFEMSNILTRMFCPYGIEVSPQYIELIRRLHSIKYKLNDHGVHLYPRTSVFRIIRIIGLTRVWPGLRHEAVKDWEKSGFPFKRTTMLIKFNKQ